MKTTITTLALFGALFISLPAHAGADHKAYMNTPEYKQIDSEVRSSLQNCLNNENMLVKQCMKIAKKQLKYKKKALKQQPKEMPSANN